MIKQTRAERRREGRVPRSDYQRAIDPLRRALLDLTDYTSEHRLLSPQAGSCADADLQAAGSWSGVLEGTGENVCQFANLSLVAAEESLRAMSLVHGNRRAFVIADKVLARAALEACGRALYLLDPGVDPPTRVNRALSERLHGLDEHRKVAESIPEAGQLDRQTRALLNLVSAAKAQGLPVHPTAKPPFVGRQRPGSNEALELALADLGGQSFGAATVRFLAWFVHTTPTGILTLGDRQNLRVASNGQTSMPLVASTDTVKVWLGFLGTVFARAQQAYLDYFGHLDADWTDARRSFSIAAATK